MAAVTPTPAYVRPLPGQGITQKWLVGAAIDAGMGADLQTDGFIDPTGATSADFVGLVCTTNGKSTFAVGDVADVIVFGRVAGFSGLTPGAAIYLAASGALADTDGGKLIGYAVDEESIFITRAFTATVS
jgi:hypothetical protein